MNMKVYQVGYVEPLLFLYFAYMLFNVPLANQLLYHKVCLSLYNATFCRHVGTPLTATSHAQNLVEEQTAEWSMYFGMARTIPAVPTLLLLGVWSDRVGRKDILVFSLFGEVINSFSYFVNTCLMDIPILFLLPGNVVSGFFGNLGGVFLAVFAYIADTSSKETRTSRILMTEALGMFATVLSCLTGGVVVQKLGLVWLCNLTLD